MHAGSGDPQKTTGPLPPGMEYDMESAMKQYCLICCLLLGIAVAHASAEQQPRRPAGQITSSSTNRLKSDGSWKVSEIRILSLPGRRKT